MKGTSVLMLFILLCVNAWAQRSGDYRSNGTVRLNAATNWQQYNGSGWINATIAPSSAALNNNNTITISANHTWSNTSSVTMPNRNFIFLMQSNSTNFTAGTTINWNTLSSVIFENTSGTVSYAISNQIFNNLEIRRSGSSGNYTASFSGTSFTVNNTLTVGANTTFELSSVTLSLPGNNKTFTLTGNLSLQSATVNIPGNSATFNANGTVTMNNSTINFTGNSPTLNTDNTVSLVSSTLNFDGNNARYNQDEVLNLTNSIIDFKGSNAVMHQNANINFLNPSTSSSYIKLLAAAGRISIDGTISGASPNNYIQLGSSSTATNTYSLLVSELEFPIGTANNYLPISVERPALTTYPTLTVSVFEGVTNNGQAGGTAFTSAQKINLVDAVWRITSSSNFTPSAIDLGWQQPLEGSGFASLTSNIGMSYFNAVTANWTTSSGSGNGLLNIVNRNYALPTIGTAGMSFGVGIIGVVLPLQLTDFRAVPQQSSVQLSWTTSSNGNSYFEVERSSTLNGNYVSIALVNSGGDGEQKYRHTDLHPLKDGYYRIRTVYENREAYSATLKVQLGNGQFTLEKIFPTVSRGSLNLVISSPANEPVTMDISDLNGRTFSHEVKQLSKGSNQYLLNTSLLPKGNYLVLIKNGETVLTGRFIRQ